MIRDIKYTLIEYQNQDYSSMKYLRALLFPTDLQAPATIPERVIICKFFM
jgi:hypothetical protein